MSGGQVHESPLFLSPLSSPINTLGPLPGREAAQTEDSTLVIKPNNLDVVRMSDLVEEF